MGLVGCALHAQSAKDAKKAFQDKVLKKRFFLQGFSADPQATFQWTGTGLTIVPPKLRTIAVVEPQSVYLKKDRIDIEAIRSTLLKDASGKWVLGGQSPCMLVVELQGADPFTVFPSLTNQLFFLSLEQALAAIPSSYKEMLPYAIKKPDTGQSKSVKSTAQIADSCPGGKDTYRYPELVKQVDPEYSQEARDRKFNGSVQIALTVDESGHVIDPWLALPSAYGLDQQAAQAVLQYVFKPGTCGGVPIRVPLSVDVNFQIY
jgi:TonB family protein